MPETIKIPGMGPVKKQYVYVGGALVVGIAGYAWWNYASAPPADVPAYTEEDVTDAVSDTPGGSAGAGANSGGAETDASTTPDTDAEWVNLAVSLLTDGGWDAMTAQLALGRYIHGETLTASQADLVRAAIGVAGYPPGGHYEIKTGTGATPSALTEPKNLKATSASSTAIRIGWSAVAGATGYRIWRSGKSGIAHNSSDTVHTVSPLAPVTTYTISVAAVDASGREGPKSTITARTATVTAKPNPPKPAPPKSGPGRHRTWRISPANRTLSELVAAYNRYHKTSHRWQDIWAYNVKWRSSLKGRTPDRVVLGSAFWFPY